jgi:hypothetical protein
LVDLASKKEKKKGQNPEQMLEIAKILNNIFGGTVVKREGDDNG